MGWHLSRDRAITGLGSGVQREWCETNPNIVLQVTNGAFTYAMPHPNTPSNFTPVYTATIAADGSFRSQIDTGTMRGKAAGNSDGRDYQWLGMCLLLHFDTNMMSEGRRGSNSDAMGLETVSRNAV